MYALLIVVCPFVLFLLAIVLSVFLRYTDYDGPFGIFKLFLDCLIDNIFVQFGGLVFRQMFGIPMGTQCVPLLADLFYVHVR